MLVRYILKRNIKNILKKFIINNNSYYKKCDKINKFYNICRNEDDFFHKIKFLFNLNQKEIKHILKLIFNYKKKKTVFNKKLINKDKINYENTLLIYKFFIFKGWLHQSYVFRKKLEKNFPLNFNKKLKLDEQFYKLISFKKIAIVGPSSNFSENGKEIDSYDVVVRMNQADNIGLSKKFKGIKTDVIYFNGTKTEKLINKNDFAYINKAKFLIFKTEGYVNLFKTLNFKNVRRNMNIDNFLSIGSANMLPYIIYDLINYSPKKIKIFDNDLMINPTRMKNYQTEKINNKEKFLKIIFEHDPLSQFYFIKKMIKKYKNIQGDKRFNATIKMKDLNFLKKLEKSYDLH